MSVLLPESQHIAAGPQAAGYRLIAYPPESRLRFLEFAAVTLTPGVGYTATTVRRSLAGRWRRLSRR